MSDWIQLPSIIRCGVSNAITARRPASGTPANPPSSNRSAQ
jgi:hypothetical protein